jgi:hypothetical protein
MRLGKNFRSVAQITMTLGHARRLVTGQFEKSAWRGRQPPEVRIGQRVEKVERVEWVEQAFRPA